MTPELLDATERQARAALRPPPRLRLSEWIERSVVLPEGVSALPGPVRLWPFQREIADAIGDPRYERITLVKPVRVGFTTLLTAAIASFVVNDPSPIMVLLPTEDDCRDYMVSDIEPIFDGSPALMNRLSAEADETGRSTLFHRRFPGGSLKMIPARAPRNLRRHNVRILLVDEADGMETTKEGPPIRLAERRTISFGNRKIIIGSTPTFEETSNVLRSYAESDQRVFEVPCPECGDFTVPAWRHIVWDEGRPETAAFSCPHCGAIVDERDKRAMVERGRWVATRPEVRGHAGFRFNALVSPAPNATWSKLVEEFLRAKDAPGDLQIFVNTILAEGWRGEGEEVDETELEARAEPFGLNELAGEERLPLPAEVLVITVGVDIQDDRIELTFLGWTADDEVLVLGHDVIWGAFTDDGVWHDLDEVLKTRWAHPLGGTIGVDAAIVDSGDGEHAEHVYRFCFPRARRRIFAHKGVEGFRRLPLEFSKSKVKGGRLVLVGVDTVKQMLFRWLTTPRKMRFSSSLPSAWYEQLTAEKVIIRYRKGQPERRFVRIGGRRAEALDCTVYAIAARQLVRLDAAQRRAELARDATRTPGKSAAAPNEGQKEPWLPPRIDGWLRR